MTEIKKLINDVLSSMLELQRENHTSQNESFEDYKIRMLKESGQELEELVTSLQHGYQIIIDRIELQLEHYNDYKIKPENLAYFLHKLVEEGSFFKDSNSGRNIPQYLLGINDDLLLRYYNIGKQLMDELNWAEAKDVFMFLTFLNPSVTDFWQSLGVILQSQQDYEHALTAYLHAASFDDTNPEPHANAFQCLYALSKEEEAQGELQIALQCCGEREEYVKLKEQLLICAN